MPDYLDNSVVGFNHQDAIDARVDTYKRLAPIIAMEDNPAVGPDFANNLSILNEGNSASIDDAPKISISEALISKDPKIKEFGLKAMEESLNKNPAYKYNLGRSIETPINEEVNKFSTKDFGYSAIRDNEDFYYDNVYMKDGWFKRNLLMNPLRFTARVIPMVGTKFMSGLGYVGSMLNPANFGKGYWADVADNGFSRWFEGLEQEYKDQIIPVYKKAGFDDKGFFTKLTDWTFWNNDVADAVAFMGSAIIPGAAMSKLGMIGKASQGANWFGKAFSATSKIGKVASRVGVGSWAELSSLTFNTAMEAGVEASGVFKDAVKKMNELRAKGVEGFANLSDEDIRQRAGKLAANTVYGNFAVLLASNAWENTLIFKSAAKAGKLDGLGTDLIGKSKAIEGLGSTNPFASSLSRTSFYGKKVLEGIIAEGFWEENAQLAIQRANSLDENGNLSESTFLGNYFSQIKNAFSGKDEEALESIGLGALIGMGAGTIITKVSGERKERINKLNDLINYTITSRDNLFSNMDVFKRKDGNIEFDKDNNPIIDPEKFKQKAQSLDTIAFQLTAKDRGEESTTTDFILKKGLSNYVRSINNIGIKGVSEKIASMDPEVAKNFGIEEPTLKKDAKDLAEFAKKFEELSDKVNDITLNRKDTQTSLEYITESEAAKSFIYSKQSENIILNDYISKEYKQLVENLNKTRGLNNSSISEFPVDQLNNIIYKKKAIDNIINSVDFNKNPEIIREYYKKRSKELQSEIDEFKSSNELILQDSEFIPEKGFYIPTKTNEKGEKERLPIKEDHIKNQKRIAQFEGAVHANDYFTDLLLDEENWLDNFKKYKDVENFVNNQEKSNAVNEGQSATSVKEKNKQKEKIATVFSKYKEQNPGDFAKVVRLLIKIASNRPLTDTEIKLQESYKDLVNELLPEYNKSAEDIRVRFLQGRVASLNKKYREFFQEILLRRQSILEKSLKAEDLVNQLKNEVDKNSVSARTLKNNIYAIEKEISTLQNEIDNIEKELVKNDERIAAAENEIKEGSFEKLVNILEDLKEERKVLSNTIEEKKGLLKNLQKILRDIIKIAKNLFPGFSMEKYDKILDPSENMYGEQNRLNASPDILSSYDEIALKRDEVSDLKKVIKDLEDQYQIKTKLIKDYNAFIGQLQSAIISEFTQKYVNLAEKESEEQNQPKEEISTENPEEAAVNDFNDSFMAEPPISSKGTNVIDDGYDGPDYIRPLSTKFFTSTFTDARNWDESYDWNNFSESEKIHFEFLEFVTSAKNKEKVNKKLGKAKLKVIAVTVDNMEKLGLKDLLYTEKDKKYWDETNPAIKRIDYVHVVEEGGKLFFIDKELNKLSEVGEKIKNPEKLVRTILRSSVFTSKERKQYLVKHTEEQLKKAEAIGLNNRKEIFEKAKKFDIKSPNNVYNFSITRGISQKQKNEDGSFAKNPLTKTVINSKDINGQTVVINTKEKYNFNGQEIELPIGRPFIKVEGKFPQLVAADNQLLDDSTVNTVISVFKELSKSYVERLEEFMKTELNGKSFSELSKQERISMILKYNEKTKNIDKVPKFNPSYVEYLRNIVYFGTLKRTKEERNGTIYRTTEVPNPKKIYINGDSIFFGDTEIPLSSYEEFEKNPKVKEFLKNSYHNVAYYADSKKANKPFIEYVLDKKGELDEIEWPTYNHYLLSDTYPDGKKRDFIPITTEIKTEEQHKLLNTEEPYLSARSRSIIVNASAEEGLGKNVVKSSTTKSKTQAKSSNKEVDFNDDDILEYEDSSLTGRTDEDFDTEEEENVKIEDEQEEEEPVKKSSFKEIDKRFKEENSKETSEPEVEKKGAFAKSAERMRNAMKKLKEQEEKERESTPTEETDESFTIGDSFRLKTVGFFKTEKDLDSVIDYVKKVLPQFPVERLKKVIKTLDGREAFGQFIDNTIKIWEGAEEGSLYHEMFEAVANRILSDYEWNSIVKEFKQRSGSFYDRVSGKNIQFKKASDFQIKEQIAEEFREFKLTGKMPVYKNTRTFFQVILDFIKSLFTNRVTIKSIFEGIDEGKFAERKTSTTDRFTTSYRLVDLPVPIEVYSDFLNSATVFMFKELFYTENSLTALDELGDIDEVVYENIKDNIDKLFLQNKNNLNKMDKNQKISYNNGIQNWEKIKGNWSQFVQYHKLKLRPFKVVFKEEEDLSEESNDIQNRNDYTGDMFKVNAKNSATPSVRFLVGTLIQSEIKGVTTINGKMFPIIKSIGSNNFLPKLENYDRMMFKVLDELSGLNSLDKIEKKLKDLSGISDIENANSTNEANEIAKSLNSTQAAFALLYSRLFHPKNQISEEALLNLQNKFLSYVSKQTPSAYIAMIKDGVLSIERSTRRPFYESFYKRLQNSISLNINDFFTKINLTDGNKAWVLKDLPELNFNFIFDKQNPSKDKEIQKFLTFLGLDKVITPEVIAKSSDGDLNKLFEILGNIRKAIGSLNIKDFNTELLYNSDKNKKIAIYGDISIRKLDIYGHTQKLIDILDKINPQSERTMQFLNGDNEAQQIYVSPSFSSKMISEMNNVETLEELLERFPHLKHSFSNTSITLSKLFDKNGKRTSESLNLSYIEGFKDQDNDKFKKSSKLEKHERFGMHFILNLMGMYQSLPADSETEWIFNFGEFIPYQNKILSNEKIIKKYFIPMLYGELQQALDFNKFKHIEQLNKKLNPESKQSDPDYNFIVGKSMRFFKDFLKYKENEKTKDFTINKTLVNKIHNDLHNNKKTAQQIIDENYDDIVSAMKDYIKYKTFETKKNLLENRVVTQNDNLFTIKNLPKNAKDINTILSGDTFIESDFNNIVAYQTINSMIGYMEQIKLLFGDIAQFKDWEKRAKSFFSPVEQMYFDKTGEFNKWLHENKNIISEGNKSFELPKNDMFYYNFKNHANARTIDDFKVVDHETVNDLKRVGSAISESYEEIEETDGQSVGTLLFARELFIKSGWRWTKEFEEFFKYDSALARFELSEKGIYTYPSMDLAALDYEILEKYKDNPPTVGPNPAKTLGPSVRPDGTRDLLKHSIYWLSYQNSKEYDALDLYVKMLKEDLQILNFKSAQKVGATLDNNNSITSYYSNPFEKNDLTGNPVYPISYHTFGIQVETQGEKNKQRIGSQLTKDIYLNMLPNGVPQDFRNENNEETEGKIIEKWNSLTEDQRLQYKDYKLVRDVITSLEQLKERSVIDLFDEIGIKYKMNQSGELDYTVEDLTKLQERIKDELTRLEVDMNTIDSIELTEDLKSFLSPAESLPTYDTISNVIWALSDQAVSSFKVNGKPFIQVASSFFTKGRKAAYKEGNTWVTLNNKEEYDNAVKSGKKPIMTSSDLKFYTLKEGDTEIQAMEVYVPHIYKQKINDRRKELGLRKLSDNEIMDHLNKNPKLLEGVGFRIPTQALSSIEFFKIKGFLPETMGDSIVVPSAITKKAGSDFDVDKLNTYLNNWTLDEQGLPTYVEFEIDTDPRSLKSRKRYIDYVKKSAEKNVFAYIKALTKEERSRINKEARELINEIRSKYKNLQSTAINEQKDLYKETLKDIKSLDFKDQEIQELFAEGKNIFWQLDQELIDLYMNVKDSLEERKINGPQEIYEYLELTEMLLRANNKSVRDNKNILNDLVRIYNKELDYFQISKEKREELREQAKNREIENIQTIKEFYKNRKKQEIEDSYIEEIRKDNIFSLNFDMSNEVAKANNLLSFEDFLKLPLHLQNSRKAVENKYFESIRNILKQPEKFEQLLSPNNMDNIIEGRDAVYDAKGKTVESPKREINYANYTDLNYIVDKRQAFVKGKRDIGIFAVAMTNFANSQVVGIGVADTLVKPNDEWIMELANWDVNLPFSEINVTQVNDTPFIPMSGVKSSDGKYIMDKISGYINGAVDVAKDPVIFEMGVHTDIAGVYIILERMGLPTSKIALFLQQPSIRKWLKEYIFLRNNTFGWSSAPYVSEISKGIISKYTSGLQKEDIKYDPSVIPTVEDLKRMILKGENNQEFTNTEKMMQYNMFITFLKLRMYSQNLLEHIQASNHDTSKIRSSYILLRKDFQLDMSKTGNAIVSTSSEEGIKNASEALREKTFIDKTIRMLKMINQIFSKTNLLILQRTNPSSTLYAAAKETFLNNPYMTSDDYHKIMKEFESSMIDILLNNNVKVGPAVISKYRKNLFKEIVKPDGTIHSNIGVRFNEIKSKFPNLAKSNFLLKNLEILNDNQLGVYTLNLNNSVDKRDIITRDTLIDAWASLFESQFEEVQKFAQVLMMGTIIQNGIKSSRQNITQFAPIDRYRRFTSAAFDDIDTHNFSTFYEEVVRANSYKKDFVKEEIPKIMTFLRDNGTIYKSYSNRSTFEINNKFSPRMGQRLFLTKENINNPVFFWKKYAKSAEDLLPESIEEMAQLAPRFVVVRAVRPEFIYWDINYEQYRLSSAVASMIKSKDNSWYFSQLYKLVGSDGNTGAVVRIDKGSKKDSPNSISLLYKPINSTGAYNFNEIAEVTVDDSGNVIGDTSILKNHYPITNGELGREKTDEEIINNLVKNNTKGIKFVQARKITAPATVSFNNENLKDFTLDVSTAGSNTKANIPTMELSDKSIVEIAEGKKTITIGSEKASLKINIPVGETQLRKIGGDIYEVTNRGNLTLEEAGGLRKILKESGLKGPEFAETPSLKRWLFGEGRLYVYDIKPYNNPNDKLNKKPGEC